METEVFVHVDLLERTYLVGRIWTRSRSGKQSSSFEYDADWLSNPKAFSLEPALTLGPGPFHTTEGKTLFGALGDSAPDRWGRTLMRLAERYDSEKEKRTIRTLNEIDYLLRVDDVARQGALRFSTKKDGPFLSDSSKKKIPPLIALPKLLSAANNIYSDKDSIDDLKLLLAPGSSLGGARPKVSIYDKDGSLAIAKFPHGSYEYRAVIWEAIALSLARKAKINVTEWRLETVANNPVLLLKRFDRVGNSRLPFLSAMSMLNAKDNEQRSYLEIADALRQFGSSAKADMQELWRRIVFSIMISNTDDHLRNHGFLYNDETGWKLSPAYDLNPIPLDIKPRILSTTIGLEDGIASLDIALNVAPYFELSQNTAEQIVKEVKGAVKTWRKVASDFGLKKIEIDRMKSAFEYND